jgi:hypothetical protein
MFPPDLLLSSLDYYGVHFLAGEQIPDFSEPLPPEKLLAGLTIQPEARMRLAIIAVLLLKPEFSLTAKKVLALTPDEFHNTFQLYYTAACYLQKEHFDQLEERLGKFQKIPDLFSEKLNLKDTNDLQEFGQRHKTISGMDINWQGTCELPRSKLTGF